MMAARDGSIPWLTVMSEMACTMFSDQTDMTALAAASRDIANGLATSCCRAAIAALRSRRILPPRKNDGSM